MIKKPLIGAAALLSSGLICLPAAAQDAPMGMSKAPQVFTESVNWSNAEPTHMEALKGERFEVLTQDNRRFSMNLTEVIAGKDDPNRPAFLTRKQSVIAVFEGSDDAIEYAYANGSITVALWHPKLGQGHALLSPVRHADGSTTLEIVLN